MSSNWVSSVDMLADAGIVGFDAAAYVTDRPARFVGSPQYPITQMPPLNLAPLPKDEYQSTTTDKSIVKNPSWKKILFGILAFGGIIWSAKKISNAPAIIKNAGTKIADFFKNIFKKKP